MKKVIISITTIIFILCIISFCTVGIIYLKTASGKDSNNTFITRINNSIDHFTNLALYRDPNGLEYEKIKKGKKEITNKNIIVFGCGFAEGLGLDDKDTFEGQLANYIKAPVYNRGLGFGYLQHAIMQVQTHALDKIIKNSNYIIFINSSENDLKRLKVYPGNYFEPTLLFSKKLYPIYKKNKNGVLEFYQAKHPIIKGFPFYRLIEKYITDHFISKQDISENFYEHMLLLDKELKEINPNVKLVLLLYYNYTKDFDFVNKLKEKDIIVLSAREMTNEDLSSDKYRNSSSYYHPTKEAWALIVPEIVKELKLK